MRSVFVLASGVVLLACGGPSGPGGACDPASAGSCLEGLICADDADGASTCQIALGGECDPAADPSYCQYGSECVAFTEVVDGEEVQTGRCYLPEGAPCDPDAEVQCDPALECAELVDGTHSCQRPFLFRGHVRDSSDMSAIEGALVLALDEQSIAVTDVATSDADGAYELRVPVLRNMDASPIATSFTLRASADGYQTFPGGIRTALPISTSLATMDADGWVVSGTLTDIVLVPVADPAAPRVAISGHVVVESDPDLEAGVLVVAEPSTGGAGISAVSDAGGAYTIFNVAPGDYDVRGYAAGVQLTPVTVSAAGADLTDVDLVASSSPLSTVSGSVQFADPGDCVATSVILVVESTFDPVLGRGELPPGLRAPPGREAPSVTPSTGWTIENVPDGRYVVLAAFENDFCVRDPDTCIAGTDFVTIDLPSQAGTIPDSFKVTGALAVSSPGVDEPEAVTAPPTFEWEGDSSDTFDLVEVFDAYGDLVWTAMPAATGSATESILYEGPFDSGMYYQFRVTSLRGRAPDFCEISRTEDLRGVFFVP